MNQIEEQYKEQLLQSTPITFNGICLYPVLCKDIEELYSNIQCLLYSCIQYPSQISGLPRLYFLTDILSHQEDINYLDNNMILLQLIIQLKNLLSLVLKSQKFDFIKYKNRWILQVINDKNEVINIKSKDFDTMREIILCQNGIGYDDTFIHEDMRKWIEEQEANDKTPSATLEDYAEVFMMGVNSSDIETFNNTPVRRYNRMVEKILSRENYNIQMTAAMSGLVSFKDNIDTGVLLGSIKVYTANTSM